jgi:hypothetical protein
VLLDAIGAHRGHLQPPGCILEQTSYAMQPAGCALLGLSCRRTCDSLGLDLRRSPDQEVADELDSVGQLEPGHCVGLRRPRTQSGGRVVSLWMSRRG